MTARILRTGRRNIKKKYKFDFCWKRLERFIVKITNEMVIELNKELANKGCPFRYEYDEVGFTGNPHMKISLPSMKGVDSFIINPTKEFSDWLELWFKDKGVELSHNNDGSIMWSKDGWDNEKEDVCVDMELD